MQAKEIGKLAEEIETGGGGGGCHFIVTLQSWDSI